MKAAQKQREQIQERVEAQAAFYYDALRYETGGESMEKKTVSFQREQLYQEIWEISLSKVAKKYDVPYAKLKDACVQANIPLPSLSYWGNLQCGKEVSKTPLPPSDQQEISVTFSYRVNTNALGALLEKESAKAASPEPEKSSDPPQKSESAPLTAAPVGNRNLYDRETLYQEVWEQPVTKVAEKYGVSDVMIRKVCIALNVPLPPRGYWAKKQAGQKLEKTPLPVTADRTEIAGRRTNQQTEPAPAEGTMDRLAFLSDEERNRLLQTALALQASPEVKRLHPILQQHKAAFHAWGKQHPRDPYADWKRDSYGGRPKDEPALWECVSEETLPRVYGILDPLYRAVERLGGSVQKDLTMTICGEHVALGITEGRDKTAHVLTKSEQKELEQYERDKLRRSYVWEPKFRKYDYIPNGKLRISAYGDSFFRDTKTTGVEERIGEILLALYMESERVRIEREKREEAQRKAEEERRKKELRRQRYNDEIDRLDTLLNEASDFQIACKIRAYVASVASKSDLSDAEKEWIAWATAKADWYDPTVSAVDPVFGKRDHGENAEHKRPTKRGPYFW